MIRSHAIGDPTVHNKINMYMHERVHTSVKSGYLLLFLALVQGAITQTNKLWL